MDKFAERLKELRIEKGLSQLKLAREVGVSQSAIKQWENKTREPSGSFIVLLSRYFGVTTDYLLGEKDE